jgi:hypothetical protein
MLKLIRCLFKKLLNINVVNLLKIIWWNISNKWKKEEFIINKFYKLFIKVIKKYGGRDV